MVSRAVMLCHLHDSFGNPWILEQPSGSLMQYHPDFQWLLHSTTVFRVFLWMGAYGGASPKATWLYSNRRDLIDLYKAVPDDVEWHAQMVVRRGFEPVQINPIHPLHLTESSRTVTRDGHVQVCGADDLKLSQHYPAAFGEAVYSLYNKHHAFLAPRRALGVRQHFG